MKDLIIDFETLGDYPDAVVPAVAFVAFDMKAMDTFEELKNRSVCVKLDLKHQLKQGRVINQRTVDWWKTQPEEAKWMMKPDAREIGKAIDSAVEMIERMERELRLIAETYPIDAALDPQRAIRIARNALKGSK